MSYGNIVPDIYRCLTVGTMNNYSILDIDVFPDPDIMNIAANYCIEPDAGVISNNDISHNSGILGQKTPLPDIGDYAFNCLYQCHSLNYLIICKTVPI